MAAEREVYFTVATSMVITALLPSHLSEPSFNPPLLITKVSSWSSLLSELGKMAPKLLLFLLFSAIVCSTSARKLVSTGKGSFEDDKTLFRRPRFGGGAGGEVAGLVVEVDLVGVLVVDWEEVLVGLEGLLAALVVALEVDLIETVFLFFKHSRQYASLRPRASFLFFVFFVEIENRYIIMREKLISVGRALAT